MSILTITTDATQAAKVRETCARMEKSRFMRKAMAAAGKRVEKELRAFFAAKPSNKKGWRSQSFWRRRIRNATQLTQFDETGATVTIADPAMNLKVYGGVVKPRSAKFLTIPAQQAAYGRSARTFTDLVFIPLDHFAKAKGSGKLVGMLVKRAPGGGVKKRAFTKSAGRGKLNVFYWCVAHTTATPDRTALPSATHITTWATQEIGAVASREMRRTGGAR